MKRLLKACGIYAKGAKQGAIRCCLLPIHYPYASARRIVTPGVVTGRMDMFFDAGN